MANVLRCWTLHYMEYLNKTWWCTNLVASSRNHSCCSSYLRVASNEATSSVLLYIQNNFMSSANNQECMKKWLYTFMTMHSHRSTNELACLSAICKFPKNQKIKTKNINFHKSNDNLFVFLKPWKYEILTSLLYLCE